MMDELELLKRDWQKKEGQLPKLSYDQIYKMIWKKSSSMVKWIFYISIAEFLFWIALSFIPTNSDALQGEGAEFLRVLESILEVASYVVIIYFIFKFYQNYRKISTTDSARELMKNIIRVRKTVMLYVWFNLGLFAISMIVVLLEVLILDPPQALTEKISSADSNIVAWLLAGLFFIATILFFGLILGLFYRLIYGILLRKLNKNYKELKKLEV
jgi:hypothetical protein